MPMEATLLVILLEERKRTNHAINELQAEIEKLKQDQERLQYPDGHPQQPVDASGEQDDGP
jgi:hypothetical protein